MKSRLALMALILAGAAAAVFSLKAAPQMTGSVAREHLRKGALLIDVRTVEEFEAKRVTNAVNIPLAEVKEKLPSLVTNKSDVLLLHCRTGRRSGIAERELRALGYTNAFNIGSFEQAEAIVKGKPQ